MTYDDLLMATYELREKMVADVHRPHYIGRYERRYEREQFYPEVNGKLSWLGSMLAGPETLVDDKGRRIFMGWIRDARDWEFTGWTGVMTLPWHFYPGPDIGLKIAPVQELEVLRYDEVKLSDLALRPGDEVTLDALCSDCMQARITLAPDGATEFGIKLLCSPDGEEETTITYNAKEGQFVIDFERSSTNHSLVYPQNTTRQIVPYSCDGGELDLDLFVDRSVIEVFVNSDVVLVQRVYPTRGDSRQFKVFSRDGSLTVTDVIKWEMDASNPW